MSIDDDTHRLARIRAAELDTSVSALVRGCLMRLASGHAEASEPASSPPETERERRSRLLHEVIGEITSNGGGLRTADNLPRDALHDRNAIR